MALQWFVYFQFSRVLKLLSLRIRDKQLQNINARARHSLNPERASVDNEARVISGRDFDSSRPSLGYLAVILVTSLIFGAFWRHFIDERRFRNTHIHESIYPCPCHTFSLDQCLFVCVSYEPIYPKVCRVHFTSLPNKNRHPHGFSHPQ